jgi:kumamolisin
MSKVLLNSTRVPVAGFCAVRSADPDQIVETTLVLRRANEVSDEDVIKLASKPLADRKYVTHQQLAENHGAYAEDVAKVIEFAHANGLAVVEENPAARIVKLSGTVMALQKPLAWT